MSFIALVDGRKLGFKLGECTRGLNPSFNLEELVVFVLVRLALGLVGDSRVARLPAGNTTDSVSSSD